MRSFPQPLPPEKEHEALESLAQGDRKARELLIRHNLRLVAHVIKKYNFNERDVEDYISIGIVGLIKAIDSYDLSKGSRLATYASRCIENEILMTIRSSRKQNREVYLEDSIGNDKEGNEIHLLDILENEDNDCLGSMILNEDVTHLHRIMGKVLSSRELEILALRYGFTSDNREYTQREVAQRFHISRSYVSRIEKKAIQKLRLAFEERDKE